MEGGRSFPVQKDGHFPAVCRYVERNALRAKLVKRAEDWPWSSLARRVIRDAPPWLVPMRAWPADANRKWVEFVNRPETVAEVDALRGCIHRGSPFGHAAWQQRTAVRLKLESSLRNPWRPKKPRK